MAKYFGSRPHWAQPKPAPGGPFAPAEAPRSPPFLGTPQGGPLAKMGREGQIIPPLSAGKHRRGSSLPGYGTPRSGLPAQMSRARAAQSALGARGLLGPAAFMMLLDWFQTSTQGEVQGLNGDALNGTIAGYTTLCQKPFNSCVFGPTNNWLFQDGAGSLGPGTCAGAQCVNLPLSKTWAEIQALPTAPRTIVYGEKQGAFNDNPRTVWTRPALPAIPWPVPLMGTQTRRGYYPDTNRPPKSDAAEKSYPRTRSLPRARMWGDRLPPGGRPVKPDWPPHVPPPPNVKERKSFMVGGKAAKIYGGLTEFRDFLDCLAGSMPGQPCKPVKNQLHKYVACIVANEHLINMPEATVCMHQESAKDAAYSLPDRMGRPRDNPFYQRPVGPTTGFWSQPSAPSMTKM